MLQVQRALQAHAAQVLAARATGTDVAVWLPLVCAAADGVAEVVVVTLLRVRRAEARAGVLLLGEAAGPLRAGYEAVAIGGVVVLGGLGWLGGGSNVGMNCVIYVIIRHTGIRKSVFHAVHLWLSVAQQTCKLGAVLGQRLECVRM